MNQMRRDIRALPSSLWFAAATTALAAVVWTACARSPGPRSPQAVTPAQPLTSPDGLTVSPLVNGSAADGSLAVVQLDGARPMGIGVVVYVGSSRRALRLVDASSNVAGKHSALSLEHTTSDEALSVRTTLAIESTGDLAVALEVENRGGRTVDALEVGLRTEWPGRPAFAPTVGFQRGPLRARVPWVARPEAHSTYAVVGRDGPADVSFVADHVGHGGVIVWAPRRALPGGERARWGATVLAARGTTADLAPRLWAQVGVDTATIEGTVGVPARRARIAAYDVEKRMVLQTAPRADGTWQLAVPAGTYRVELRTAGGKDEETVTLQEPRQSRTVQLIAPQPGQLELRARDGDGRPLPVRWIATGVAPTPNPSFDSDPGMEQNVVFAADTGATVDLPEGSYHLTATRGPEYTLFEQDVSVVHGRGAVVRATLARVVDTTGWLACDFHLHAAPSPDSEVTLEDRLSTLVSEGIEFAVATDHNVVTDYGPTIEAHHHGRITSVPGVEVTTRQWGHFNVFPLAADAPAPPHRLATADELFSTVRADSPESLIQVNHPLMADIGYFQLGQLDVREGRAAREGFSLAFDTLEVFNGFDLGNPGAIQRALEAWLSLVGLGHRITAVGNSDSHRLIGQWAGYPRTYVEAPDAAVDEHTGAHVVAALRRGAALVTNGPFVDVRVGGSGLGTIAKAPGHVASVTVAVQAAPWVSVSRLRVVANGRTALTDTLTMKDGWARRAYDVPVEVDTWLVVVVEGDAPLEAVLPRYNARPLAFTNPIFVDADGDGAFGSAGASPGDAAP